MPFPRSPLGFNCVEQLGHDNRPALAGQHFAGEIPLPHLKITASDHKNKAFGIQWQRYWKDAAYPDLVKTVAHVAFEVDDLVASIAHHKVLIEPNSPSPGVMVAFIEVNGAPVELLQVDGAKRPDV